MSCPWLFGQGRSATVKMQHFVDQTQHSLDHETRTAPSPCRVHATVFGPKRKRFRVPNADWQWFICTTHAFILHTCNTMHTMHTPSFVAVLSLFIVRWEAGFIFGRAMLLPIAMPIAFVSWIFCFFCNVCFPFVRLGTIFASAGPIYGLSLQSVESVHSHFR